MSRARVIGVHAVPASEPCYLIEIMIEGSDEEPDLGAVTQPIPGQDESNWQVPWDECFLSHDGSSEVEAHELREPNVRTFRIAFFFHYLDLSSPLSSPWGELQIPSVTERPRRLAFMQYEALC